MKSLRIFLGIAFLFHTLYILGADHLRLLPQPQQCVLVKGYFVVGKMAAFHSCAFAGMEAVCDGNGRYSD